MIGGRRGGEVRNNNGFLTTRMPWAFELEEILFFYLILELKKKLKEFIHVWLGGLKGKRGAVYLMSSTPTSSSFRSFSRSLRPYMEQINKII